MFGSQRTSDRSYKRTVLALFSFLVLLNVVDLLTSRAALEIGLSEGNGALLATSGAIGIGTIPTMALLKVVLVVGAGFVSFLGIHSPRGPLRSRVFLLLLGLTLVFGFAALNNIYLLFTA